MNNMINLHKKIMKQHQNHFWKTHSSYLFNICSTFDHQIWSPNFGRAIPLQDGSVTLEEFISGLLTMKGPAKAIDVKTIAAGPGDIWGGISPSIGVSEISDMLNMWTMWKIGLDFGDSTYFAIKSEFWDDEIMGFEGSQVHKSETSYGDGMGHITLLFGGMKSHIRPDLLGKCRNVSCDWDGGRKTQWTPTGTFIHIHTLMDFYPFILWTCLVFSIKLVFELTISVKYLQLRHQWRSLDFFPLETSGATEGYDIGKEFRRMKRRMQNLVLFAAVCRSPIACQGRCSPFHLNLENSTVICRSGSHVQIMSHRMSAAKRFHIQQLLSCCLLQPRSVDHQLKEIRGMLTKWETAPLGIGSHFCFFAPERLDGIWIYGDPSP